MDKRIFKLKMILLTSIIILIAITISYGAFYTVNRQTGDTSIYASCFNVEFFDGESINMSGALPLTDGEGMYSIPYEFSLTNNCNYDITYKVVAYVSDSSIDNNFVRYMYGGMDINTVGNREALEKVNLYQIPRVLGIGTVKARTKSTEELRFWLDEKVDIEYVKNKSWNAQIKIISGT